MYAFRVCRTRVTSEKSECSFLTFVLLDRRPRAAAPGLEKTLHFNYICKAKMCKQTNIPNELEILIKTFFV